MLRVLFALLLCASQAYAGNCACGGKCGQATATPDSGGAVTAAGTEAYRVSDGAGHSALITLLSPKPTTTITRLPGPTWSWGPCPCMMCLANHLVAAHGVSGSYVGPSLWSSGYLSQLGYSQWQVLHDNLHNSPEFAKQLAAGGLMRQTAGPQSLFVPTPIEVVTKALALADVDRTDLVYDLGCGDGRVLVVASKLFRARSVGLDLDPFLAKLSQDNVNANKVDDIARVYCRDILATNKFETWATVVFLYLTPDLSAQLVPRLQQLPAGSRVIAVQMAVPGLPVTKSCTATAADGTAWTLYLSKIGEVLPVLADPTLAWREPPREIPQLREDALATLRPKPAAQPEGYTGIVWVHSETCTPCRRMEPAVTRLVLDGRPILVVTVASPQDFNDNGVSNVPTTFLYKHGAIVDRREGEITEDALRGMLKTVSTRR